MKKTLLLCLALTTVSMAKPLTPYNQGYDQGRQAGRREGEQRGYEDGRIDGQQDGYQAGYQQALQAFVTQAQDEAFQQGVQEATQKGHQQGTEDGLRLGREEGLRAGAVAGEKSADDTARQEVTPRAYTAGIQRAQAAHPKADGARDGAADGLKRAKDLAHQEDYPRGQAEVKAGFFAEPISQQLQQRQSQLSLAWRPLAWIGSEVAFGKRSRPNCDYRFCNYPSDNEEFQRAYRKGYDDGFASGYDSKYSWYYDIEFRQSASIGASQARPGNLDSARDEGYHSGYDQTFESIYNQALATAKEQAYAQAFQQAFSASYSQSYPRYLKSHAQSVEKEAFESLYRAPYKEAFQAASEAGFSKNLPAQRQAAYQQGMADERADFAKRPVRLLEAWVTPTDVPGIRLLSVKLRNFSSQPVQGHRVHLFWNKQSSRLYHALPPKSVVVVTGAFRIDSSDLKDRDLAATIKTNDKDLPLGKVSVWPSAHAEADNTSGDSGGP